ncbi:class 1b ribonucleoside-diphosphate reductase subunit alpha [Mycobacteroides abscessus]|uniref:class 1b ribonucleoside-diphosphate reductase subunit alpha n=1 Tax=Mycobacteroides abscessus TaxID=36809 RepID=UPI001E3CAFE7
MDYHALNAELNLVGPDGKIQFEKDKEAARQYFLQHVNQNTVFFHSLEEKLDYLVEENYYEQEVLEQYSPRFVKLLFKQAYDYKFRFPTFLGAFKFYTAYAMKTFDGGRYLERYEDRVCMVALTLARGNEPMALSLLSDIISGRFQPATPTFLNAGKKQRGEMVSCFLLRVEDNMESIGRGINSALQLSKRGGGVALLLSNLREAGAPIKHIAGQSSGVIPVMKLLEDSFSYANQLGARQGAGAVYLHAHHPDVMKFLDTKRENADEKIRIKTLSLGVVVPDITFELAKNNRDMALFSPYDVERFYGIPLSDIEVSARYDELVANDEIGKTYISAREFFQTIAELQFESGYPYLLFEDNANRGNPIDGKIVMSNLCSEILQVSKPSVLNADLTYDTVGQDISCNLGSLNIARVMESGDIASPVGTAIRALTSVAELTSIDSVPSIREGNRKSRSIGLGQMNLHGYLASVGIDYGSPEALEFTDRYFRTVLFHALTASNQLAIENGEVFDGFEKSKYADGSFFDDLIGLPVEFEHPKVRELFKGIEIPRGREWLDLRYNIVTYGLYNRNLQAVAPTGSISYINHSTSSIHPIVSPIEVRKEGKIGRVYYPAPGLTNDNVGLFKSAYDIGYEALIDTYAVATRYVDQGLSLTMFFKDTHSTRDLNKAYIYAWRKGIKTLYYSRIRQAALEGTEVENCVSCTL